MFLAQSMKNPVHAHCSYKSCTKLLQPPNSRHLRSQHKTLQCHAHKRNWTNHRRANQALIGQGDCHSRKQQTLAQSHKAANHVVVRYSRLHPIMKYKQ